LSCSSLISSKEAIARLAAAARASFLFFPIPCGKSILSTKEFK